MGYFNISGLEPIADGLKAIAKALAGPERQQDYALTPVVRIPDIPRELPTEPRVDMPTFKIAPGYVVAGPGRIWDIPEPFIDARDHPGFTERRAGVIAALLWMMNDPALTSGGNTAIALHGFVRKCAQAWGIDLAKEQRLKIAADSDSVECSHWEPDRITLRKGCTACAAEWKQWEEYKKHEQDHGREG